jgi:hypothetical protein
VALGAERPGQVLAARDLLGRALHLEFGRGVAARQVQAGQAADRYDGDQGHHQREQASQHHAGPLQRRVASPPGADGQPAEQNGQQDYDDPDE